MAGRWKRGFQEGTAEVSGERLCSVGQDAKETRAPEASGQEGDGGRGLAGPACATRMQGTP